MTKKFDTKVYLNKSRVYRPITGAPRVLRLWVWDREALQYKTPEQGKCYEARRYDMTDDEDRIRKKQYFETLEEARKWQAGAVQKTVSKTVSTVFTEPQTKLLENQIHRGPKFRDIIEKWKLRRFPTLQDTTRIAYEKILRLHLGALADLSIHQITPEKIDEWLDHLKNPKGMAMKNPRRISFRHELEVLSAILRYYEDYHTDRDFYFPIKRRHWGDTKTERIKPENSKDLSESEFLLFRAALENTRYGSVIGALATVQYYQALRISEAAGLYFEDIKLDSKIPSRSRICIRRCVIYPRVKHRPTYIKTGFKNSQKFPGGVKELPVFPQTYEVLAKLISTSGQGLLFSIDGEPIEYRTIQYYYNLAFQRADLPYTATHVLRHGWTREVFNQTPDLAVAKELLGDTSDEAAKVYAIRRAGALTKVSDSMWSELEVGRKWSQVGGTK